MLEIIGAVLVTILAVWFIGWMVFGSLMAIGFGGWRSNWIGLAISLALSAGVVVAWWFLVGTHIHVSFG